MSSSFNDVILSDKLSKLNSSQQSIETLSHWCIFHRKRASQVVQTWQREFFSSPPERRLPLLYLANDILQNSRKKGPEFISEFWTALPPVLQQLVRSGPDSATKAAYRIIDIWEERKVFGQREESLRLLLLGSDLAYPAAPSGGGGGGGGAVSPAVTDGSSGGGSGSSPDERSTKSSGFRIPAKVRGALERIATAYAAVQDSSKDEDMAIRRCSAAVSELQSLEKEIADLPTTAPPHEVVAGLRERLSTKLALLGTCCDLMSSCETKRTLLVKLLTDALNTQESKLERLRSQLQVGRAQAELAAILSARLPLSGSVRLHLTSSMPPSSVSGHMSAVAAVPLQLTAGGTAVAPSPMAAGGSDSVGTAPGVAAVAAGPAAAGAAGATAVVAPLAPSVALVTTTQSPVQSSADEAARKKEAAAALAARMAASTSSAALLSSVLTTLAKSSGAKLAAAAAAAAAAAGAPPEKRQRVDSTSPAAPAAAAPSPHLPSVPPVPLPATPAPPLPPSSLPSSAPPSSAPLPPNPAPVPLPTNPPPPIPLPTNPPVPLPPGPPPPLDSSFTTNPLSATQPGSSGGIVPYSSPSPPMPPPPSSENSAPAGQGQYSSSNGPQPPLPPSGPG